MSVIGKMKLLLGVPPTESPLISVLLHFRQPISLPEEAIHAAIRRAWGRDLRMDLNEHVANNPPVCFVKFETMLLLLSNLQKPYCPPEMLEKALAEFSEVRQREVVRVHKGFLAIDLHAPKDPGKTEKRECYRRMCRLAAEFVDNNCMGVYLPEIGHMRPYDANVISALRSEEPLKEIQEWGQPPVMLLEDDDPRLRTAVVDARQRWPEFVKAFETRQPDQIFAVKALFTDKEQGEWMWVNVSSIGDGMIEGKLGNRPASVRNVHEGDQVTVRASEIGDWLYQEGKRLVGGFSLSLQAKP
jgi:uncharacterized protein YegJ (DUF2314 family)